MGDPTVSPLVVTIDSPADVEPAKAAAIASAESSVAAGIEALTAARNAALAGDLEGAKAALETVGQHADWLSAAARTIKAAQEYGKEPAPKPTPEPTPESLGSKHVSSVQTPGSLPSHGGDHDLQESQSKLNVEAVKVDKGDGVDHTSPSASNQGIDTSSKQDKKHK